MMQIHEYKTVVFKKVYYRDEYFFNLGSSILIRNPKYFIFPMYFASILIVWIKSALFCW